jgi:serine/threonine protein kinase
MKFVEDAGFDILEIISFGGMSTVLVVNDDQSVNYILKIFFGYGTVAHEFNLTSEELYGYSMYKKYIPKDYEYLKRKFLLEIDILSRLSSDYWVKVEKIEHEEYPYYLMKQFGVNLEDTIQNRKEMWSVDEITQICVNVLKGLNALHELGYVHRDLTPYNILIDKDLNVKICDLGNSGSIFGSDSMHPRTPYYYFPPEQDIGIGESGISGDIYSIAVIAYRLLTGHLPRINAEIPHHVIGNSGLIKFIDLALKFHQSDRFQTTGEAIIILLNK